MASPSQPIQYPDAILTRAERAILASPFRWKLLAAMQVAGVELNAIADDRGIHNGYTERPLAELSAENELLWLISVGLLRREVDGQGLTDSFRLTPLGRQLLSRWQSAGQPNTRASLQDRLYNALNRWWRRPDWLP